MGLAFRFSLRSLSLPAGLFGGMRLLFLLEQMALAAQSHIRFLLLGCLPCLGHGLQVALPGLGGFLGLAGALLLACLGLLSGLFLCLLCFGLLPCGFAGLFPCLPGCSQLGCMRSSAGLLCFRCVARSIGDIGFCGSCCSCCRGGSRFWGRLATTCSGLAFLRRRGVPDFSHHGFSCGSVHRPVRGPRQQSEQPQMDQQRHEPGSGPEGFPGRKQPFVGGEIRGM